MSLEKNIQAGNLKIGTKQTMRQVELGHAAEVFVAEDADPHLIHKITNLCTKHGVKMTTVDTMKKLGKACGIEVGAAMAVLLND